MRPRERVLACIERMPFDRIPIRHLAEAEINEKLYDYFKIAQGNYDALLDAVGDDFRTVSPVYCGPAVLSHTGRFLPAKDIASPGGIPDDIFPHAEWFDYSGVKAMCVKYKDYAKIAGYCEFDFINAISFIRGFEQVIIDIAERDPVYTELVKIRARRVHKYLENILQEADGGIDIVHFGEDLGTQLNLLISIGTFDELFAEYYARAFETAHKYGAKTMMHSCGSVWKAIPRLAEIGLDILDVVQTNAAGMEIERLKDLYGRDICFAGSMCVQHVLPFETAETVRAETKKRVDLFSGGGLILGPSHLINPETPVENIIEMYKTAGGIIT
jgi:uroporphyrinogen decarboxylase